MVPTADIVDGSDTGISDTDNITSNNTPTITGTTENNATVTIEDSNNNIIGTGVADDNGNYSITTSAIEDGTQNLTITSVDSDGNSSETTQAITVDTIAPDISNLAITNIQDLNGDNLNMLMSGTGAESGNTITLYNENNNAVASTEIQVDGTWNINISNLDGTPINDNEFFKVVETDIAGNETGQTDTTHYANFNWSNASTENNDDYNIAGSGNDNLIINDNDLNDKLIFDGGEGNDTASFEGNMADYNITTDANGNTIVMENANTDSDNDGIGDINELRNVETVNFADGTYDIATGGFAPFNEAPNAVNDDSINQTILLGSKETQGSISDWGTLNNDGSVAVNVDGVTGVIIASTSSGTQTNIRYDTGKDFGLGVKGGSNEVDLGETVTMTFDNILSNATIGIDSLYGRYNENSGQDASVEWVAYKDGIEVANGNVVQDYDNVDGDNNLNTNEISIDVPFDKITLASEAESGANANFTINYLEAEASVGISTNEDTTIVINSTELLANDTDIEGDTLSISEVSATADTHGTVSLDANGNVVFTPEANYNGNASFEYTVSDGQGGTNTATVALNVKSAEDLLISENFENGADGWTNNTTTQSNGELSNFLGRFGGTNGAEGVSKTFEFGAEHAGETVNIAFDMYEIDSWDGNSNWNQANEAGQAEAFQTFVNGEMVSNDVMTFDDYSGAQDDGGVSTTSNEFTGWGTEDIHHYSIQATVDANGEVQLGFGSTLHQSVADESWGIDNITIASGSDWIGSSATIISIIPTENSDAISGTESVDTINALDGNDYIDGGAGADNINAGAGDDNIVFDGLDNINGGIGFDTLIAEDDITLDFDDITNGSLSNVEAIDLNSGNSEILNLELADVLDMTGDDDTLTIFGDNADNVELQNTNGNEWLQESGTTQVDGHTFITFTNNDATVLIDDDIPVTVG